MNKKMVTAFLIRFSMILVLFIAAIGIIIAISFEDMMIRGAGIGIAIGVLIGGFIKIKMVLPKQLNNKDERTLLIYLLSTIVSETVFGITAFMYFLLNFIGVFTFNDDILGYYLSLVIIIVLTMISYYGSNKYLERKI